MLPFGHTAVGYLIAKTSKQKLTNKEVLLVVITANIFDLDFFLLTIFGIPGGQHHYYPGHTPLMGLIYWLIIYLIFRNRAGRRVFILMAVALLSHLIIDDFSYWLTLIGLEKNVSSQINWFFPLTQKNLPVEPFSNSAVLYQYLITSPKLFYLEIIAVIGALVTKHVKLITR